MSIKGDAHKLGFLSCFSFFTFLLFSVTVCFGPHLPAFLFLSGHEAAQSLLPQVLLHTGSHRKCVSKYVIMVPAGCLPRYPTVVDTSANPTHDCPGSVVVGGNCSFNSSSPSDVPEALRWAAGEKRLAQWELQMPLQIHPRPSWRIPLSEGFPRRPGYGELAPFSQWLNHLTPHCLPVHYPALPHAALALAASQNPVLGGPSWAGPPPPRQGLVCKPVSRHLTDRSLS